jgi:hypothetical protein
MKLKTMILQHSPLWPLIVEEYEQTLRQQQAQLAALQQTHTAVEQERDTWQRLAQQHEQAQEKWQQLTQQRESIIAALVDTTWIRLGLRIGIVKQAIRNRAEDPGC